MRRFDWLLRFFLCACVLLLPLFAYAQTTTWEAWLVSQIQQHPDVLAARQQWLGSNASADAMEPPQYNPTLSTDLERIGAEDNFRFGVSQTIDWWNISRVRQLQASHLRSAAESRYRQEVLDKTADALAALVEWRAAKRVAVVTQTQQQQLNTLLELVEKRQQAGDLGSVDAELAFLSLSQQLAQAAEVEAALQKAEIRVRELLPEWSLERSGIPDDFWPSSIGSPTDEALLHHPIVASAYARWQSLKVETKVTQLAARAEPTVGLNAGRDGGENVVGLTLSMPLNVRNNFNAEIRAASRAELEAEAHFQAAHRKQRFDWQAAQAVWQRFDRQYRRWQTLVLGRITNSAELLERQWRSGDLSTPNYLLALNQRAESLRAGIELEKQTRLALTAALQQSGRLARVAKPSTTN